MTIQPISTWILAAMLAVAVTGVAYRFRALAPSGVIAATMMGIMVVGLGGWWPGIILVAFFASSSLISRAGRQVDHQARGARRDWVQVIANGWAMLLGCVLFAMTDNSVWLLFGIGGIAAATADTWSSEIGRPSAAAPRLITSGRKVPAGTSGAVSGIGIAASIAGAAAIGTLAGLTGYAVFLPMFGMITLAGVIGGTVDSLLGATIQERRFCDACQQATESNPHRCGASTRVIGGIRGVNNDAVNIACVLTGAIIGAISGILFV